MFCKKCGTNLDDDALFCENCGTAVRRIEPAAPSDPLQKIPQTAPNEMIPQDEQVPSQTEAYPFMPQSEFPAFYSEIPKKKSFPKWIIFVAIAAIAAIAILAVILLSGNENKNSDFFYHEINYNNVAHFAYDSERLYFIGDYNKDDEESSVYSTDYNGVNKKLISSNDDITRIRIFDNKLYYYESAEEVYKVGVMNLDGTNNKTIVTADSGVMKYIVYQDHLYYVTDTGLYCCTLTGEANSLLMENAETFTLDDGMIYYICDDVISEYNIKKDTKTELCKAEGATDLVVKDNTLFFACDSGLSSIVLNGNGMINRVINDSELDSYVFHDGFIYYKHKYETEEIADIAEFLAEDDNDVLTYKLALIGAGKLYQANLDGSNVQEVDNTDDTIIFTLYHSPNGLYHKSTAWSSDIEKVEFEQP